MKGGQYSLQGKSRVSQTLNISIFPNIIRTVYTCVILVVLPLSLLFLVSSTWMLKHTSLVRKKVLEVIRNLHRESVQELSINWATVLTLQNNSVLQIYCPKQPVVLCMCLFHCFGQSSVKNTGFLPLQFWALTLSPSTSYPRGKQGILKDNSSILVITLTWTWSPPY